MHFYATLSKRRLESIRPHHQRRRSLFTGMWATVRVRVPDSMRRHRSIEAGTVTHCPVIDLSGRLVLGYVQQHINYSFTGSYQIGFWSKLICWDAGGVGGAFSVAVWAAESPRLNLGKLIVLFMSFPQTTLRWLEVELCSIRGVNGTLADSPSTCLHAPSVDAPQQVMLLRAQTTHASAIPIVVESPNLANLQFHRPSGQPPSA
jgi:hypothetical protein